MKDIAIYRLQRIEKALERLDSAVSRLENASAEAAQRSANVAASNGQDKDGGQLELAEAELAALRRDYDTLRKAATTVVDRLDETIERFENSGQVAAQ